VLVIHLAIQRAFEMMHAESPGALATMKEDDITIALRAVLENQLRMSGEVPGFDRTMFERVERQHRCVSYDGSHLAKEPDMRIRPS
jgi:hypothetical protein